MHLLRSNFEQLVNIELIQAVYQLIRVLCVLFKNKRQIINHLPNQIWCIKGIKEADHLGADYLEGLQIVYAIVDLHTHLDLVVRCVVGLAHIKVNYVSASH